MGGKGQLARWTLTEGFDHWAWFSKTKELIKNQPLDLWLFFQYETHFWFFEIFQNPGTGHNHLVLKMLKETKPEIRWFLQDFQNPNLDVNNKI
jgi:hypothetical protein